MDSAQYPGPVESPDVPSASTPESLQSKTRRGGIWIGSSIAIQAGVGGIAQIMLGRWLSPYDFGLFALYISSAFLFAVLASGGIRTALTQKTSTELDELLVPALKTSMLLATGTAIALSLASPVFATIFGEPELAPIIIVGSLALPLRSYAIVAIPALQARFEFRHVAVSITVGALSHYVTALILASLGWGAMSLVIGAVVGATTLSLSLLPGTASLILGATPSAKTRMTDVRRMSRWPLLGDLATESSIRVDYFVLGLFAPTAVVGGYYFAYQLVSRAGELLLGVARNVLFPVLAQIQSDSARQIRGMYRAAAALAIATGAGAALLIAAMPGVEQLIWGGKWAVAVPAMALLATALPLQIAVTTSEQLLKAKGKFKQWTTILLLRASGVAITALTVGIVAGDTITATTIAGAIALYLIVEALLEMAILSRMLSFSLSRYWKTVIPLWIWFVGIGWLGAIIASAVTGTTILAIVTGGSVSILGLIVVLGPEYRTGWFGLRPR